MQGSLTQASSCGLFDQVFTSSDIDVAIAMMEQRQFEKGLTVVKNGLLEVSDDHQLHSDLQLLKIVCLQSLGSYAHSIEALQQWRKSDPERVNELFHVYNQTQKIVQYRILAARQANFRRDLEESLAHAMSALNLSHTDRPDRAWLYLVQATNLIGLSRLNEATIALVHGLELGQATLKAQEDLRQSLGLISPPNENMNAAMKETDETALKGIKGLVQAVQEIKQELSSNL